MLVRGACVLLICFFFSSRRRHTIFDCDWSSDVCSSDLDLFSNSTPTTPAGFTLDGYGGIHPFGFHPNGPVGAGGYWPGRDLGISVRLNPGSGEGRVGEKGRFRGGPYH